MARKGYRSKLKSKLRQKRASAEEADGAVINCSVCVKRIVVGGKLQKRRIIWEGIETHACNACGISWSTFKAGIQKSEKREPTPAEWAAWEATRPQCPRVDQSPSIEPLPTVYEAAAILVGFRNSFGSSTYSSPLPSSSFSTHYPQSTASPSSYIKSSHSSLCSKSNEVALKVESSTPIRKPQLDSLYVEFEPIVDAYEDVSDHGMTDSTGSSYSPREPITPLFISFLAPIVSSAPLREAGTKGESAYQQW